jgi:hypothetical protein
VDSLASHEATAKADPGTCLPSRLRFDAWSRLVKSWRGDFTATLEEQLKIAAYLGEAADSSHLTPCAGDAKADDDDARSARFGLRRSRGDPSRRESLIGNCRHWEGGM